MNLKNQKIQDITEKIRRITIKEERIPFAFLFGSYARGEEIPISDIDIAIYFKDMDEDEKTEIEHKIWLLFDEQINILRLEDDDISPLIRLKSLEGIPIIIRDKDFLNRFTLSIIHRAVEAERVLERLRRL